MKLDPGFLSHWKTELLIDRLGPDGVLAVLRLWGNAQIRRQWKGMQMTPKRLAMETKWKGDENHLFSILTDPDAPWLDLAEDGTYSIHGFETHQKQVIHLWESGAKGGRPRKVSRDSSKEEKTDESAPYSSSSSSSSSPICEPNENQMVFEMGKQGVSEDQQASNMLPKGCEKWDKERKKQTKVGCNDALMGRIGRFLGRRPSTLWTVAEALALRTIKPDDDELELLSNYYGAIIDPERDIRRRDLQTLLNNWNGEVDRARAFKFANQ